ncbi:MAG: hypothetical protein PWP04_1822 [Candidatus Atribacteria bacterium]|nr:hypothetical protein [Candidatus Atribacteria bacterium]
MTHKDRYIRALHHQESGCVPCAPELWFLVPARLSGLKFYEISPGSFFIPELHKMPLWKVQLDCARFFDVCGWVVVFPEIENQKVKFEAKWNVQQDGRLKLDLFYHSNQDFLESYLCPPDDAPWYIVHPVKNFEDWKWFKEIAFPDLSFLKIDDLEKVYQEVGDAGIVSVAVGGLFFDFLISSREGGLESVFEDLYEHPDFFRDLHQEYIDFLKSKVAYLCKMTTYFDELFIGCSYSSLPIVSPQIYQEWEIPLLKELANTARKYNRPLHLHQHGRVREIMEDIVSTGINLVCPLESPPLGNVDLSWVKEKYGNRIALKGNVSTTILCEGPLEAIEEEVRKCIKKASLGGGYILGTGDQVHRDTPFEHIKFMKEMAEKYGKYPTIL